jgi:putative (di)nucleoside polyphosphate hydrolase
MVSMLPRHLAEHPGLIHAYRPNAAAVVVDMHGRILWCERVSPPGVWQFPQGGIDPGETPEQAMWRELGEELGLSNPRSWMTLEASLDVPLRYRFPAEVVEDFLARGRRSFIGQEQHFFLLRWSGDDSEITLEPPPGEHREFSRFVWGDAGYVASASPFKRDVTQRALELFHLI